MSWVTWALLLCLGSLVPGVAQAHELRPAVLALRELSPGRFEVRFSPVQTSFGTALEIEPRFPRHCQSLLKARLLDCGERGLVGAIEFPGLELTPYRVAVRIEWANGLESVTSVGSESTGRAPGEPASTGSNAGHSSYPGLVVQGLSTQASLIDRARLTCDYVKLGIQHILSGFDHLAFVLGLLLLSGRTRKLLWTVTAFTLAHSLTLAAAMLGIARVPSAPVEATIALSILLVAVESSRRSHHLTQRWPWLVAMSFGLLHGFGFAGALAEIGLPPHQRGLALLGFNIGVELGQLAVIAVALGLTRALTKLRHISVLRTGAVYALGALASYWTIERSVALFVH